MSRIISIIVAGTILRCLLPMIADSSLHAFDDAGSNLHDSKNLRVVIPESYPYHYRDTETGMIVGTDVDRLNRFLSDSSLGNAEYHIVSWSRALAEARLSPETLIMPLTRKPERDRIYHWLYPLRETWFSVFSVNPQPLGTAQINEQGIEIYCENGGIQCSMLEEAGVSAGQIKRFPGISHDRVVDLAVSKRLKYFIAEQNLVEVGLERRGLPADTLTVIYTVPTPVVDYIAIGKNNDPALLKALDAAVAALDKQ